MTDPVVEHNVSESIPRILHYCWFGGKEFPKTEAKCYRTWQNKLKDFTLMKWDESNFNFEINLYVKQASDAKKWMYVSDYARLKALYEEGGLYLDTDCKVLRSFIPLLSQESSLGFTGFGGDNHEIAAHAIACPKHHPFIKECLDSYIGQSFIREDGTMDTTSINIRMTNLLIKHGFKPDGTKQVIAGLVIYPMTYFTPSSFMPGKVSDCFSKNSYCIHIWSDPRLKIEKNPIYKLAKKIQIAVSRRI